MDDYNVSVLSEAKNEYSLRLVNILTPLILEGIKSILKEAWQLCLENDEEVKYSDDIPKLSFSRYEVESDDYR